jgi:heme-degrading monooxygenase HmoA
MLDRGVHITSRAGFDPQVGGGSADRPSRPVTPVILEHALLPIRPGREEAFEAAFVEARAIVAASPRFQRLSLSRCLERPGTYLLLVESDRIEDHIEGFRGSAGYQRWRELLHAFYDPFPTVEHFREVLTAVPADGAPSP